MAFSIRAIATAGDVAAATSITCTKPTGTVDGDLMFAFVMGRLTTTYTMVQPGGWTLLGEKMSTTAESYQLYYKVASAEGASYIWTSSASIRWGLEIFSINGSGGNVDWNASNPVMVTSNTAYVTADTILRAATMSVSASNAIVLWFGGGYNGGTAWTITAPSVPAAMANIYNRAYVTNSRMQMHADWVKWTGSGATGNMDGTITSTALKHAFAVALNTSPGTPGTVTTNAAVTGTNTNSTTAGGTVTASGGAAVTQRGAVWNTSPSATISNFSANSGTGLGAFTVAVTGLTSNTLYYLRAFAYNGSYFYGSDINFTTSKGFNDYRQSIINGIRSAQSETHGWNADVLAALTPTDVIRTSDTVVTITLPAISTYNITTPETVTVSIPSSAVANSTAITGSPAFVIANYVTKATSANNCIINVSNVAVGGRWCSCTDPSIFKYCQFTGGGGHAIRLTAGGEFTLTGNTFSGFGSNSSSGAAIFNDSGTAVTLNIVGGGNIPSYRNGAGSTTTVNSSFILEFTGLQPNSEVRCYTGTDPLTAVEIGAVENSGTSFSFSHSAAGQSGFIVIHALGYQSYRSNITYSSADQSIPIQQIYDRQYQNL